MESRGTKPVYAPSSQYNPRPTRETIVRELAKECEKVRGSDGCRTHPVRIWLIRRALEYLTDEAAQAGGE